MDNGGKMKIQNNPHRFKIMMRGGRYQVWATSLYHIYNVSLVHVPVKSKEQAQHQQDSGQYKLIP